MIIWWPWWVGAFALAAVSGAHFVLLNRPLGVSGAFTRIVDWKHEAEARRIELELAASTGNAGPGHFEVRDPVGAHAVFLLSVGLGAFAAWVTRYGTLPQISWDLGPEYAALIGTGPVQWASLLLGGIMVGFGTRMAGGCTSGHGLVGCAGGRPASLTSTALFFGTGIAFSFLLAGLS